MTAKTGLEGPMAAMTLQPRNIPAPGRPGTGNPQGKVQTYVVRHLTQQEEQDMQARVARVVQAQKAVEAADEQLVIAEAGLAQARKETADARQAKETARQAKEAAARQEEAARQAKETARAQKEALQAKAAEKQANVAQLTADNQKILDGLSGMLVGFRKTHAQNPAKIALINQFEAEIAKAKLDIANNIAPQKDIMTRLQQGGLALMQNLKKN